MSHISKHAANGCLRQAEDGSALSCLGPQTTSTDNPFIEAFNGRLRAACLDQQWFLSLDEARRCLEEWRRDYNTIRPHTALDNQSPAAFTAGWHEQQTDRETG